MRNTVQIRRNRYKLNLYSFRYSTEMSPAGYYNFAGLPVTIWPTAPISYLDESPYVRRFSTGRTVTYNSFKNRIDGSQFDTTSLQYFCQSCETCNVVGYK